MRGLPARVLIALGITVIALLVLAGMAIFGGSDGPDRSGSAAKTGQQADPGLVSTSTTAPTSTVSVTTTTLEIPMDWYPKGSSRYSNRKPSVTVTTIAAPNTSRTDGTTETTETEG
ncbi:MAG: hypothetical protein WBF71_01010 [Microthrixaceae bacterium]